MDDWLVRGGIIAEMLSIVLIAPELLGRVRLLRIEATLEALLPRVVDELAWWRGEDNGDADTSEPDPSGRGGRIADAVIVPVAIAPWALFLMVSWAGDYPSFVLILSLGLLIWAVVGVLVIGADPEVSLWIVVGLSLPALLSGLGFMAALGLMISLTIRFLKGPERLRIIALSAGGLLLMSGLAAQLWAAF